MEEVGTHLIPVPVGTHTLLSDSHAETRDASKLIFSAEMERVWLASVAIRSIGVGLKLSINIVINLIYNL